MTCVVQAQFGPQQIITNTADGTRVIFVADFDGDSFPDVVSANKFGSSITWYKNLDGTGFGSENLIATINQPINVHAADIDGDDDLDVLSLSAPDDLIVWYENLDGLGAFSSQKIISSTEDGASEIVAADVDGDLDLDVISGSDSTGLSWFENMDGSGIFGPKQIINASASNPRSISVIDIDGDTDLDIVASSSGTVTVVWYENLDGLGNFGGQQIVAPSALAVESIFVVDLDGDLDNDILAGTPAADRLVWYENLDGMGSFGGDIVLSNQTDGITSIFAADLDNDDDIDVLSSSFQDGKIAWYENLDGFGDFGLQQIITTNTIGTRHVFAADVDNDTDIDVFSASQNDDKIAWYENLIFVGVEENELLIASLIPNPVVNKLYISSEQIIKDLKLYDSYARLLFQKDTDTSFIDLSHFPAAIYFVEIVSDKRSIVEKVIKK